MQTNIYFILHNNAAALFDISKLWKRQKRAIFELINYLNSVSVLSIKEKPALLHIIGESIFE